jgi:hypothetical protein
MPRETQEQTELGTLNQRIRTLLPEQYQDRYEDVQPISMGSAGLKYGRDGMVAWNEMWGSFCDLAMAGGHPIRERCSSQAVRRKSLHSRINTKPSSGKSVEGSSR